MIGRCLLEIDHGTCRNFECTTTSNDLRNFGVCGDNYTAPSITLIGGDACWTQTRAGFKGVRPDTFACERDGLGEPKQDCSDVDPHWIPEYRISRLRLFMSPGGTAI